LEDIYNIARTMRERSMARYFQGTVKVKSSQLTSKYFIMLDLFLLVGAFACEA